MSETKFLNYFKNMNGQIQANFSVLLYVGMVKKKINQETGITEFAMHSCIRMA